MKENQEIKFEKEKVAVMQKISAVVLISLVWIAVLTIGVILAWLFDGGEFFIRTILTLPFSFGGVYASWSVWKHYR
jgi:hypothetical protein